MRVTTRASKIALFALLPLLVSGLTPVAAASPAGTTTVWTRVAGADRYETAVAVSKSGFPAGASSAVVASGELFPDGLSASYVAGQAGGPVLLTGASSVPAATLAEVIRLHVSTVYVAGGTGAVSTAVQNQLAALRAPSGSAVAVRRLAGADRYATAAAIATGFPNDSLGTVGGEKLALLASGTGFADALAGSAAVAGAHLPLLLTTPDRLSPQVLPALQALGVTHVMVLGGAGAISAAVATQLAAAGLGVTRLGGVDRVTTATVIASWEISALGFTADQIAIARGDEAGQGVDALSVGAFIGHGKHPLLLTASPDEHGSALLSWLRSDAALTGGVVAGGSAAISDLLMRELSGISGIVPGTDSRPIETQLFAPTAFWTTPLPAATPVDPNSAAVVADLWTAGELNFGAPGKPRLGVNTTEYTPPVYVATNTDPIATFKWDNCQGRRDDSGLIATQLTGLHVPADALPSAGTDSEITIFNRDDHTYTDIWKAAKNSDGTWSACWGGTIRNANTSTGIFTYPFGASGTGLPFMGGIIRPKELAAGAINHVVGIAIPYAKSSTQISWPANRGDGQNPNGYAVPAQGQILRLPASLDIDAMTLSPLARAVAKAAQNYGLVVWDTAAAISFRAENASALASNPYPALFRYRTSAQEFLGDPARGEQAFPLDKLELLPMNYQA